MKFLVVEDEEVLGRYLSQELVRLGHTADWSRTAREGRLAIQQGLYDVILLDLGLPDAPGESLLRELRTRGVRAAVIVITARGQTEDRVALLDTGADDYVVKPLDVREVMARVRAVQRRGDAVHAMGDVDNLGPMQISRSARSVQWHGQHVDVSSREFDVLSELMLHRPGVVSREQLQEALYGDSKDVQSNSIDVYVHGLRRKISQQLVITVRGRGYQMGSSDVLASERPA